MKMNKKYFIETYEESRQKFIEYSSNADIIESIPLKDFSENEEKGEPLFGMNGENLYIDICVFGNIKNPENVFLHTLGVHGIESFGSNSFQLKVLSENLNSKKIELKKSALIFIHTVNPYGMSFLRRGKRERE